MNITVTLDLSTNSTGYSVWNSETKTLITYGVLKPKVPGLHKMEYPEAAMMKILDVTAKVKELIKLHNPDVIVIEEVNRGINRIAQKSLDALHFFVLHALMLLNIDIRSKLIFLDSNGKQGWRGALGLRLSDEDKKANKTIRKSNKKNKLKYRPIDWKTLSQRFVNKHYGLSLDVEAKESDADIADSIAIGHSYLHHFRSK